MGSRPPAWLSRAFELDVRSLVALRVGLGVSVLLVLAGYADVYADLVLGQRLLPVGMAREFVPRATHWLLWPFDLAPRVTAFLLPPAMGVCAGALIVGYRARLAAFGCWLLLACLQARNPALTNFGDAILLRMLFWGSLAPLGDWPRSLYR